MQLFGILTAIAMIALGFLKRDAETLGFFDLHALSIILVGSFGAILLGSKPADFVRTIKALAEFIPGLGNFAKTSARMEQERKELETLWLAGKRAQAAELASSSSSETTTKMILEQVIGRSPEALTENRFTAACHEVMDIMDAPVRNWELMSKLGPSFGIVGTITGMVQIFRQFGTGDSNIGTSMSLALLATLYGISFGAAICGPIATFLGRLMDERIQVIERCALTTKQLISVDKGH